MIDNITCKEFAMSDFDQYSKFCQNFDTIMNMPVNNTHNSRLQIDNFLLPNIKRIGAFVNDKLVGTLSGFFPLDIPYWYGFNMYINVNEISDGLGVYFDSHLVIYTLFDFLIAHGESLGYYAYYTRFSTFQQKSFEKGRMRIEKKFTDENLEDKFRMFQYKAHYETIYLANTECRFRTHKFFYRLANVVPEDTIIMFHVLNQASRKKIFNQ